MEWFMSMDVLVVLLAVGSIVIGAVTNLFILILLIWLIVRYLRNGRVVKKWSEQLRQTRSKDRI
ncbi:hypothetical protein [Exiguobacterium sp. s37]|uniref:hypothetical protein n=1 Tax=Exiguobacterium sp. s37 TaxID=2751275 RepID=UPI001BE84E08|nr:hypothetical protein [Exiguobacterium sp. s37]